MIDKLSKSVNIHGSMKRSLAQRRIRWGSATGFSLIEVVLALGVIGVALTSMLGLLPTGLTIFRESIEATVRADILRKLSSELQQTPFSDVGSSTGMRYFTDEGQEVTSEKQAFFGLTYSVGTATDVLKGSLSGSYANKYLKPVQVQIYTRADRERSPVAASFKTTIFVPESGI